MNYTKCVSATAFSLLSMFHAVAYADIFHDKTISAPTGNSSDTYTGTTNIISDGNGETGIVFASENSTHIKFEGTVLSDVVATKDYSNIFVASGAGSRIDLSTISDTDHISLKLGGYIGAAFAARNGGHIKVDATKGTGTVDILLYDSTGVATSTQECGAIEAQNGTGFFEGIGNFKISVRQARGYGIWANGGTPTVSIDGNVDILTEGSGGYGIRADNGTVHITGNLDVSTTSLEYTTGTGAKYYAYGMQVHTGKIIVDGDTVVKTMGSEAHGVASRYVGVLNPPKTEAAITTNGKLEVTLEGASANGIYNTGGEFNINGETIISTKAAAVYIRTSSANSKGIINLNGKSTLSTSAASGHGLYAYGSQAAINVSNELSIETKGATANGIVAETAGTINVKGKTAISLEGDNAHGVYSNGANATVNLDTSDFSISSSGSGAGHAFYSNTRGIININGLDHRLAWRDDGYLLYAYNGGKIFAKEGKYNLEGTMRADRANSGNAQIDAAMTNSSYYKGKTETAAGGQIDLKFMDNSVWENLVASSSLTSVGFEDSKLIMTLESTGSYSNMVLADFSGDAGSTIKIILAADFAPILGDEFLLVNASGEIVYAGEWDFSEAVLAEGLRWNTSTFSKDGTIRVLGNVPEPASFALVFGLAGIALALARKRSS